MTEKKKTLSAKRILSLVLALVMAMSLMVPAFAANEPTAPVQETAGNLVNGEDGGYYVSFRADKQNFVFIQNEDDEVFQFSFKLGAKKNSGVNYGWVYERSDGTPQTLRDPIGKSFTCEWDGYQGGLPGTLFGGNNWVDKNVTVTFVGEGGKIYDTALTVNYDGRGTSSGGQTYLTYDIPLTITVLDKRALNAAVISANASSKDADLYTEATWNDVVTALAAANAITGNVITTQTAIDKATFDLVAAVESLEYKPADYTALIEAKAAALELLSVENPDEVYTIKTLKDLRDANDAANAIPLTGWDIRNQAEIDKASSDLSKAVDGILKFADYSKMKAAIAAFEKLNASYYDANDIAKIEAKIDDAKVEMQIENRLDESKQADVDKRANAILEEIASLEMLPANYDALNDAIALAEEKLNGADIGNYTADSVLALQNAYAAAKQIPADLKITQQAKVDAAEAALSEAVKMLTLRGADYTVLDNAIANAKAALNSADIGDYTADSVNALKAELAKAEAVSRELTVNDQAVIRAAASELMKATRELKLKGADYSALDAAIAAREAEVAAAKAEGIYSDASVTRVEIAISAAKAVDRTYTVKEQAIVDDAVATLNSVKLEKKPADLSALIAAIEDAKEKLNSADDTITDESKAALREAIKEAETIVASKPDITQQEIVDNAVKALEDSKLTLKPADYTKLDEMIKEAEDFLKDPSIHDTYTPESIQKVQDALDEAKNVDRDLDILHQDEIDKIADGIGDALESGLDYAGADTSKLENAISAALDKLTAEDIDDYTEASVNELRAAVEEAQAFLDTHPTVKEQDRVDALANALNGMSLTLKGADYDALDVALVEANAKYADAIASGKYTDESLAELKSAIDFAEGLSRQLTIRDQAKVDEAMAALNVNLVLKPADLTALNDAIAEAEAKLAADDIANYTPESVLALREALEEAKALRDANPDINDTEAITAAVQKLVDVKLELRDADYTALDKAILDAEAKLTDGNNYTVATVEALKAALANAKGVDRDMDITYQSVIDEALEALKAATGNLEAYTPLDNFVITCNGADVKGTTATVKVPWNKWYKRNQAVIGVKVNSDAEVKSVSYELANWSVTNPEANIIVNDDGTATIVPNARGIGARSVWVKVTVEDFNGNTVSQLVKVRFYKWNWQV